MCGVIDDLICRFTSLESSERRVCIIVQISVGLGIGGGREWEYGLSRAKYAYNMVSIAVVIASMVHESMMY